MNDQEAAVTVGMIALETLKAVLEELGIDRTNLRTGTDAIIAVRERVKELKNGA
jgi:hypothetical protein